MDNKGCHGENRKACPVALELIHHMKGKLANTSASTAAVADNAAVAAAAADDPMSFLDDI